MSALDLVLEPIGIVHGPHGSRDAIPLGGGPAVLEVFPDCGPALDAIERSSHIVVLAWLHRSDRSVLVARPRRIDPDGAPQGVFATRSPDRPNPVSVSVVPLLRREGLRLLVDHLDLVDGTPLLDLKTYNPGWDGVFGARTVKRVRQSAIPDVLLASFLRRDLENHLGPVPVLPAATAGLAAVFAAIREFDADARDPRLHARVAACDASLDAVIGLMGGTFASGRVAIARTDGAPRFRFQFEGRVLALDLREGCDAVFAGDPSRWIADGFLRL